MHAPLWTVAGWPDGQAVSGAVDDSIAGLRIAAGTGTDSRLRTQLTVQLTGTWLAPATPADQNGSPVGLLMLCRLLGVAPPPISGANTELADTMKAGVTSASLPALLAAWLARVPAAPAPKDTTSSGTDVLTAAADELAYRLSGDARFHGVGQALLSHLALPSGLYAIAPGTTVAPSTVVTAVAMWILEGTPQICKIAA